MKGFEQMFTRDKLKYQQYEILRTRLSYAELNATGSYVRAKYLQQYLDYNLSLVNKDNEKEERAMYYWNYPIVMEQSNLLRASVRKEVEISNLELEVNAAFEQLDINKK